jgi:hypothetical protein
MLKKYTLVFQIADADNPQMKSREVEYTTKRTAEVLKYVKR